jgi:hypothetical protein
MDADHGIAEVEDAKKRLAGYPSPLDDSATWLGDRQDTRCTPVKSKMRGETNKIFFKMYIK